MCLDFSRNNISDPFLSVSMTTRGIVVATVGNQFYMLPFDSLDESYGMLQLSGDHVKLNKVWAGLNELEEISYLITLHDSESEYIVLFGIDSRMTYINIGTGAIQHGTDIKHMEEAFQEVQDCTFISSWNDMNFYCICSAGLVNTNRFISDKFSYFPSERLSEATEIRPLFGFRKLYTNANYSRISFGKTADCDQFFNVKVNHGFATRHKLYFFTDHEVFAIEPELYSENVNETNMKRIPNEHFFDCHLLNTSYMLRERTPATQTKCKRHFGSILVSTNFVLQPNHSSSRSWPVH